MNKILKIFVFLFLFIYIFCNPNITSANYTVHQPFDTDIFTDWISIPDHILPQIVSDDSRTYARFSQGSSNSFAYLANKSDVDKVIKVSFDFFYSSADTTQGAGFMLTEHVPLVSQDPPNDSGDYSVGVYPIQGSFYLLSPLCDGTSTCNLPIYSRAIF